MIRDFSKELKMASDELDELMDGSETDNHLRAAKIAILQVKEAFDIAAGIKKPE